MENPRPLFLALFLLLAATALPAAAQLGPYPVVTRQSTFEAQLIKREKDMVWVRQKSSDGRYMPQMGIYVKDIAGVRMPRPGLFAAADRVIAAPNAPAAQFKQLHAALDKLIIQTRPFRDIPGIHAEEALLTKGRLHFRKEEWRDALRQLENILLYASKPSTLTTNAQVHAGIAYMKVGEAQFAAEYLVDLPPFEDDEALLSQQLFALADAYLALDNPAQALQTFLQLVVFYPYMHGNEPRALLGTLECYARLGEWEPLHRTIEEINKTYPDSPAAEAAAKLAAKYEEELAKAGQMVVRAAQED